MFTHQNIFGAMSRFFGRPSRDTADSGDGGGMATVQQADAVALGEDTLTSVKTTLRMVDHGNVTVAHGTVKATAAAESTEDTAFANAETTVGVDGADILFVFGTDRSGSDGTSSYDKSVTMFRAVDIAHWSGPPLVIDFGRLESNLVPRTHLEGNVATAEIDAQANAENTFVAADAFVLAIEDELSLSTTSVIGAVD